MRIPSVSVVPAVFTLSDHPPSPSDVWKMFSTPVPSAGRRSGLSGRRRGKFSILFSASWRGWPNGLVFPTEMIAFSGRMRVKKPVLLAVWLPWCPAWTTSIPRRRVFWIASLAGPSMSDSPLTRPPVTSPENR